VLDPEDEALLRDEDEKSRPEAPSGVHKTWLRKTEYMGGIVLEDHNTPKESDKKKIKGISRSGKHATVDDEMDEIENNIEKSFNYARSLDEEFKSYQDKKDPSVLKRLKHSSKPNLKPTEVYTIVPNEKLWSNTYVQISFDTDPIFPASTSAQEQQKTRHREGNKLYRGTMLKQSYQGKKKSSGAGDIVDYIIPKDREANFVDDDEGQGERDYQWMREYLINVETKNIQPRQMTSAFGRNQDDRYYIMTLDENTQEAKYNHLPSKLNVKKKKAKVRNDEDQMEEEQEDKKKRHPRYILTKRDFSDKELKNQNMRRDELVPEEALNEEDEDIMRAVSKKQ
jgi:hypothetical protein